MHIATSLIILAMATGCMAQTKAVPTVQQNVIPLTDSEAANWKQVKGWIAKDEVAIEKDEADQYALETSILKSHNVNQAYTILDDKYLVYGQQTFVYYSNGSYTFQQPDGSLTTGDLGAVTARDWNVE